MSTNTKERIRSFIVDELMEAQSVSGDPIADGKLDSLAMEQVIGFIEDEYGVMFSDEDLVPENFADLATVAALVDAKRTAANGGS